MMSAMIITLLQSVSFQKYITATSVIAESPNDDGGRRWLHVRLWLTHEARMQLVSDSQFWLAAVETLLTKARVTPALNTAANKCTRNR